MSGRTLEQNTRLHTLLSETGLTSEKAALVKTYTKGRTTSSAAMTFTECDNLLAHLAASKRVPVPDQDGRANQMRRAILSAAHQMRWQLDGSTRVDMVRVNEWCKTKGYLKKELNAYTYEELPKLLSQINLVLADFLGHAVKQYGRR
jgi:hypothetical protein